MAEHGPREPGRTAQRPGEEAERPEPIDPLPRRHHRRHQQGAHEHHADELQAEDDRADDQRGHQQVEESHRESEARGEIAVEARQLQLLPEERHQQQNRRAEADDGGHVGVFQKRGLAEEVLLQPVPRGIAGVRLQPLFEEPIGGPGAEDFVQFPQVGHQHEAEAEEDRECPGQRGIEGNSAAPRDALHEGHGQPAGAGRAEHDHQRRPPAEHERQRHARQRRMGDGVALEALPPHDGERPDQTR